MLKLSDFFQPLNFQTISIYILSIIFFDILGSLVKGIIIKDRRIDAETRLINWLIGLGLFIFIWFIVGFVIYPSQLNVIISILVLLLISLPSYIKRKSYSDIVPQLKLLWLPALLILPYLPTVFYRASLPPYVWDEMAYHFVSPNTVIYGLHQYWQFTGDLYNNLPRSIDTLYILSFSVTHTYSVVRLVEFSIVISSLFTSFLLLKKLLGKIPAILFALIVMSLPLDIPYNATIGYVDFPAIFFLLIGLLSGILFIFSDKKDHFVISLIFWSMSIGTKYTTLIPFGVFIVSFAFVYWLKNKSFKLFLDWNLMLKIVVIFVIFGGYWYIKNFIVYGNPIYPFIFDCWGQYVKNCSQASSFFAGWTLPITSNNIYPIIKLLFPQNFLLRLTLIGSFGYVVFFGDVKNRLILLMILLSLGTEMIILRLFSGFDGRYQQYLVFTLILISVLFASLKIKNLVLKVVQMILIIIVTVSCSYFYVHNVNSDKPKSLNKILVNYVEKKQNVHEWVSTIFPDVSDIIFWCENPSGGTVALARFDPDLIWSDYSGMMRVYLTNCSILNPTFEGVSLDNALILAKEKRMKFWIGSKNACSPQLNITPTDEQSYLKQLNNIIICNSEEVMPNLYYFDYEKIN